MRGARLLTVAGAGRLRLDPSSTSAGRSWSLSTGGLQGLDPRRRPGDPVPFRPDPAPDLGGLYFAERALHDLCGLPGPARLPGPQDAASRRAGPAGRAHLRRSGKTCRPALARLALAARPPSRWSWRAWRSWSCASPLFVRLAWPTRTLPPGPLRQRLERLASRVGFRCTDILVWDTGHVLVNAGVTGALPWFRYVLLSDALIESLTPAEVAAVFGHEVGHIAHRHLLYFGFFFLGSLGVMALVARFCVGRP